MCHGQVCGGIGDSQPPEEGLICNHPWLILRLTVLVAGASSSVILLLLSVAITVLVTVLVTLLAAVIISLVIATIIATIIAMVISTVVAVVVAVAMAPPLLLRLCIPSTSPVFLWLLLIAPSPLCHIKTLFFIPVRNDLCKL